MISFPILYLTGNIILRKECNEEHDYLCLIDWELSCIHVPQRDLAMYLINAILPARRVSVKNMASISKYVDCYVSQLTRSRENENREIPIMISDRTKFNELLHYCMLQIIVERCLVLFLLPTRPDWWFDVLESSLTYIESVAPSLNLLHGCK